MLKYCLSIAFLALAGQACADVDSRMPIEDVSGCPGFTQPNPLFSIIPDVSTWTDDLGNPMDMSLIVKDWRPASTSAFNQLRICAMSPSGEFMGGSVVKFTNGSRLVIRRSTGTEGLSLEKIVAATTPDLRNKTFQLYVGIGGSFNGTEPQLEFGQKGNAGQYVVSAPVPKRTLQYTSMHDANDSPFSTTYYVANAGPACLLSMSFLTVDGLEFAKTRIAVPAHGRAAFNPEHSKGLPYGGILVDRGDCEDIFAMRLISFPSDAVGGRSATMTTSRHYE